MTGSENNGFADREICQLMREMDDDGLKVVIFDPKQDKQVLKHLADCPICSVRSAAISSSITDEEKAKLASFFEFFHTAMGDIARTELSK